MVFTSETCEATISAEAKRLIRNMSVEAFIKEYVLGGLQIDVKPEMSNWEVRQHLGNVVWSMNHFWCQENVQHLAGVMAAILDGHCHGEMHVLVKERHTGCTGRWDMSAVWAALMLKIFPTKFVSPHCTLH